MLTNELVKNLTTLATADGTDDTYSWRGVSGTSRPPSVWRYALRAHLYDGQGGVCFDCGEPADIDELECCHIVSRGLNAAKSDEGKGWTPGNIALGHRLCPTDEPRGNKAQQLKGPVVLPTHVKRPDVVVTEWPTVPVLKALYPR